MLTVVIPYFQRKAGVLRKALASIAAQQAVPMPVCIVVVDDASPVPAESEVAAAALSESIAVRVIRQSNGGPGAARNTGLDAAPADTRYVAFLDSDDEWSQDHLARAIAALEQGFDFYFSDHFQLDQSVGAFERAGRIAPAAHPGLPGAHANLHAYAGDMFDQILRGNVIGTSTVVFRRAFFPDARFKVEFTTAGEDYLFWMTLASRGARIAFSNQVEAIYGKGVNIYSGSGWGTDAFALRLHNEIKYRKALRRLFQLSETQEEHVRASLEALRRSFIEDILHRLRHRKSMHLGVLKAHWALDPATYLQAPALFARKLKGRS